MLCEQCSLICHQRCSPNAPPTCDLRSQLLLYAQYAERDPANSFSPYEILATHANQPMSPTSPTSQTSDDGYSRRTYISENALLPGQVHAYFGGSDQHIFRAYRHEIDALQNSTNVE